MVLSEAQQAFDPGGIVHLYELDCRQLDADILRFSNDINGDQPLRFGGLDYVPVQMEAEGFEANGRGALPTPTLRIANANQAIGALVIEYDDLIGVPFIRIRTFERFLDTGDEPDATQKLVDIYHIERKVNFNKVFIEFQLATAMDQEGVKLPRRQALRNTCTLIYRRFDSDTGEFDYSKATCPYAGNGMFDVTGRSANLSGQDVCGKRLSDCELRYGRAALPYTGFPGMLRRV